MSLDFSGRDGDGVAILLAIAFISLCTIQSETREQDQFKDKQRRNTSQADDIE